MVVVDSNGTKLPISAAQFNINADSPIKYVGVSEISDAYGAAIVANAATNEFAFADKDGNAIPSENGKYVLTLTYTVPEDCAAGTYPVKISELFASTVDGAEITDRVLTENGAIIVKVPTTTSTVTTSTVTTTSEGSTTTTTSGSTTTTTSGSTTTTTSGSTTTTTSGSTTSTTSGSTTTTTSGSTTSTTSGSTTTTTSGSTTTTTSGSTTTTTSGSTTTTTSGSTTSTTSGSTTTTTSGSTTTTTSGSTTTTTSGSTTSTTSSSTSTTSTTSSSTTSTTTTTIPVNAVIWQVESVTAKQGDTVKVPVKLLDFYNSKLPVSGAQFTIDFDTDKFELVGASDKSGAYIADIVYNPATGQYAFANGTGNAVIGTDGADVIVLEFKVKDTCPNGKYNIAIEDLFVSDANGGDITALVVTVPGKITVDGSGEGPEWIDTFAVVEKTHGFYFSHDNGTRNNGEKGGFNPGQITSLKIFNKITQDGITVDSEWAAEDVDMSKINFGDAVPSTVYDEANTTFKYEVPVYYGYNPLVDRDGNQITVTVYIGVKGDIDLNNKVLANDAAQALAFYTASQAIGADPAKIQLSESPYVTGADDVLEDFCAFLGDVDVNEWSEDNWKLKKADRKILANDAGAILTFYSESQTPGAEAQALWDEIVPERYGEIA
ncbi:MAG: hypothetical protein E7498_05830 [Ruminococcus sp.]|nr:hypothetical protein [Ruminococcus sp.]